MLKIILLSFPRYGVSYLDNVVYLNMSFADGYFQSSALIISCSKLPLPFVLHWTAEYLLPDNFPRTSISICLRRNLSKPAHWRGSFSAIEISSTSFFYRRPSLVVSIISRRRNRLFSGTTALHFRVAGSNPALDVACASFPASASDARWCRRIVSCSRTSSAHHTDDGVEAPRTGWDIPTT